jgi:hypothetical protein
MISIAFKHLVKKKISQDHFPTGVEIKIPYGDGVIKNLEVNGGAPM